MEHCKTEFAHPYEVRYKWPDDDECGYGIIIHTNMEDHLKAASQCNISDEYVMIYTDSLDRDDIKRNFDGLEIIEFII